MLDASWDEDTYGNVNVKGMLFFYKPMAATSYRAIGTKVHGVNKPHGAMKARGYYDTWLSFI